MAEGVDQWMWSRGPYWEGEVESWAPWPAAGLLVDAGEEGRQKNEQEDWVRAEGTYMAPAASKEVEGEQGEEEEVAPAAPEQQQNVDSAVNERSKKKIEELIISLASWRRRCSERLQAARLGHVTGSFEVRCLEFLESELSNTFVYLNEALSSQHVHDENEGVVECFEDLADTASTVVPDAIEALDQADPQCQNSMLPRAPQCFHCHHRRRYPYELLSKVLHFYHFAERVYWSLSRAIRRLGLSCQMAEEGGGIHPVLAWFDQQQPGRFYDFPTGSYQVMMCMIMFPYGYKFEKERLVQKVMRETSMPYSFFAQIGGADDCFEHMSYFVSKDQEGARSYFSKLIHHDIITQVVETSRRTNADESEAWQWNFSPLQHQLLASKSAEMGFAFTSATLNLLTAASATADNGNETTGRIARRLALHHDDPDIPSLLQNIDLSQTRSLKVSGGVGSRSVPLNRFINLVVLDVEGWENFGDEDLLRICTIKMFLLAYLSIRSTQVTKLPLEIKELCSLQVLDASYTQLTELPFGYSEATELRRLDIRGTPIRQLMPKQILGLQHSLEVLLLGGEGLVSSVKTATSLPQDIQRFQALRTLATADLSEQPANFISALGELRRLRVLAITWSFHQSSDRDYCEALLSSIQKWKHLHSLTIHCGLGCSMEFLGSLSGPPEELAKFKVIAGRFAVVPKWFHGFELLSFMEITICKLEPHDLETLRDLPKLRCLILGLDFMPREPIVINSEGFHALQRFSIECPVPWLTFESGAMPKLKYLQLELHPCPMNPFSIPVGINNLRSLEKVALWYNVRYANRFSVKRTVEAVREEVAKCRSAIQMIRLFINGIKQDDVQAVDEETENATRSSSGTGAGAKDDVQEVDEITEA
ncbi:hypothetical protein HU200_048812 [Digitaria exilis]|uniref:Disease resistance R13L4/SHOC-2-like LRR domain-containing protein n=1 Tax=Digitaria exilis TaxID=1010633 RepID=A0A835B5H3_9POAL|nr:hypothetical protein HU200_048812 [Digitaria exilis]